MLVTNLVCPFSGFPICFPLSASHKKMTLSMPPLATTILSGENMTNNTWSLCPSQVFNGHSVLKSQSLIVESPAPEARYLPSGENARSSTAPSWPSSVLEARVTGRILNIASGLKKIGNTVSPENNFFFGSSILSFDCWILSRISYIDCLTSRSSK